MMPSSIGAISAAAADKGAVDLALGSPDSGLYSTWAEAAMMAIQSGVSHYTRPDGSANLKEAVRAYYQNVDGDVQRDTAITGVCITIGATEALAAALIAFRELGDEVVLFEPFYEGYLRAIDASGAIPRPVPLRGPDWRIDPERLAGVVGPRTRAVIVNSPHNPTGCVFSAADLEAIENAVCKTRAVILSDEVYAEFYYDGVVPPVVGQTVESRQRVLRIGSASKMMGVTGWRVGWVVGPESLVSEVTSAHFALTACAPAPLQLGVAAGLREMARIGAALRRDYSKRRDLMRHAFLEAGFEVSDAQGAFYLIVSSHAYRTSVSLYEALLKDAGVATVPMALFYANEARVPPGVRVAFCKSETVLVSAISQLSALKS